MVPTQRKSRQGGFGCLPLVVLVMDRQRASLGSPQALKQSRPPCPTPAPTLAWSVPPALPCLALGLAGSQAANTGCGPSPLPSLPFLPEMGRYPGSFLASNCSCWLLSSQMAPHPVVRRWEVSEKCVPRSN